MRTRQIVRTKSEKVVSVVGGALQVDCEAKPFVGQRYRLGNAWCPGSVLATHKLMSSPGAGFPEER